MTFQQIYEAISSLPLQERLRLVERVVHDAVEPSMDTPEKRTAKGSPLDGLFSDIPDLVEEVCTEAYRERATRRLRTSDE
ncbi:MAG: hypothetical protein WAM82_10980 [Thermoanaerobaculia bacterium]